MTSTVLQYLETFKKKGIVKDYHIVEVNPYEKKFPERLEAHITLADGRELNPKVNCRGSKVGFTEDCYKFMDYIGVLLK